MGDMKMEAQIEEETRRYQHAILTIRQGWDRGKKRTCPVCEATFVTRKDLRIHRKETSGRCEPSGTFRYA